MDRRRVGLLVQFLDRLRYARCCAQDTAEARGYSTGAVLGLVEVMPIVVLKTLLKPVETPQVQFLDSVEVMPVVVLKTLLKLVDIPQVQFSDWLRSCPLLCSRHCRSPWIFHRCSSWTG